MKDNLNIFCRIRQSCAFVANTSKHIRINKHAIPSYAASLDLTYANAPIMDVESHYVGSMEDTVAFFLILDSINFGSGYFPELNKKAGQTGYFTIASSLTSYFRSNGSPSANDLMNFDEIKCASIFNQDLSIPSMNELMRYFANSLRELGSFIIKNYNSKFTGIVMEAEYSASKLVDTLVQMSSFKDFSIYLGEKIYFYKRAQITISDINIALKGNDLGMFRDIDDLTIFADNLVPHVLKLDGILKYSNALEVKIKSGVLIGQGCEEETEIRACALHAVELIKDYLLTQGRLTSSQHLDYLLWNRGQHAAYRKDPRHSTRTIFY